MNLIPYGKQKIEQDDIDAVVEVLRSSHLTQGPRVEQFERDFADYCGSKYAISCSNGTAALHLSVMALEVSNEDIVLTTPISFAATSNCVLYSGGKLKFIDINKDNYLLDLNLLEKECQKNPDKYKGIIAVDFAGYPLDAVKLRKIADKYNLWIIEDACHSPGAERSLDKVGSSKYVDLTVFSFHPVKHIACGEGGMITTNDYDLYTKLMALRTHGIVKEKSKLTVQDMPSWYHEMQTLGFNYRLSDISASLGITQLKKLDSNIQKRNKIAKKYLKDLDGVGDLILPLLQEEVLHSYHLYVIRTNFRDELYSYLRQKNIFCQVHYIPIYLHPYYQSSGYKNVQCPLAQNYYETCLSLPIYHSMEEFEQLKVIDEIKNFFDKVQI